MSRPLLGSRDQGERDKLKYHRQDHVPRGRDEQVGREVRDAIVRIGADLPEAIAPAEHIKSVAKRVKTAKPKLALEEKDALGLLGERKKR